MIYLGLIGYPLSHSLSPRLHAAAFTAVGLEGEYRLFPIAPDDNNALARLARRIREGEFQGLNITIPYKQTIISLLDELTPIAKTIGAVNTLFLKGGRLIGHNTDAPGFLADLHKAPLIGISEKKALILGAGGAARAVVYALLMENWIVSLAVRKADMEQAIELITSMEQNADGHSIRSVILGSNAMHLLMDDVRLIVNATPVGMIPEVASSPWPEGLSFPNGALVYDLVYNPRETLFIQQARAAGLFTKSGIGMLVEQAALSFEIWTGKAPPRDTLFAAVEEK